MRDICTSRQSNQRSTGNRQLGETSGDVSPPPPPSVTTGSWRSPAHHQQSTDPVDPRSNSPTPYPTKYGRSVTRNLDQPEFRATRKATPSPSPSASDSSSAKASRSSPGRARKRPGSATDFAEAGDGEQTTGRQPLDQFSIQPWLPVHVAHHQIHRRPWRQTLIQIPDLEPTLIGNAAALCQLAGEFDGDGRDIDTEHIHAPKGQPDRQLATAGGDF